MKILGIKIANLTRKEVLEKIDLFLNEEKFHQIATVNPEFILAAQKDQEFKNILNSTDLNVADGVGIWYAFIRNFGYLKTRITGVDLMDIVLQKAQQKNLAIYLAISKHSLSSYEEIKTALNKKYPKLKILGSDINMGDYHENWFDDKLPIKNDFVLLCNFGAPRQEKFIQSVKSDTIRLAMGVGGSFDFLTKKVRRGPKVMRKLGLEWLWRFILEPKYRAKRIFKAVIIFPIKVIFSK